MGRKIIFVLWILILGLACYLLGNYVGTTVKRLNDTKSNPEVSFEIENYGTVKVELYPEYAPNTVRNIIKLVEKGYYNDKVVYGKDEICLYVGRDSEGKAINPTAGILNENIEAGSENDYDYTIKGEFIANGFYDNTLRHEKGVLTIVRNDYTQAVNTLIDESYNSGNAQIGLVMSDEADALNGSYAAFGRVIEGMEIVEKIYNEAEIAEPEIDETTGEAKDSSGIDKFKEYPVIKTATVDTKGIEYGMPEYEEAFDYSEYMYQMMSAYYGQE